MPKWNASWVVQKKQRIRNKYDIYFADTFIKKK